MDAKDAAAVADRLVRAGLFDAGGIAVDVEFYRMRLHVDSATVEAGLGFLVAMGRLDVEERWRCESCGAMSRLDATNCGDCQEKRPVDALASRVYFRTPQPQRDPAAVFLIHGMNTLGEWQQSLSWRIQLLYGYSLPVFVFKYGKDLFSPALVYWQDKLTVRLAGAVREAYSDLAAAGRTARCDVVCHSFGTLLFSLLLKRPDCTDLAFGRVIFTGSIVRRDYPWAEMIGQGRIEDVLNHRGGKDYWVRWAPWFFPRTDSSGFHGFVPFDGTQDLLSLSFEHSDFFLRRHFAPTLRLRWTPFLNGGNRKPPTDLPSPVVGSARRHWVGRAALGLVGGAIVGVASF